MVKTKAVIIIASKFMPYLYIDYRMLSEQRLIPGRYDKLVDLI